MQTLKHFSATLLLLPLLTVVLAACEQEPAPTTETATQPPAPEPEPAMQPDTEAATANETTTQPEAEPAAPEPATAAATGMGDASAGESVYNQTCASCHATGVAGAPKLGDKAAWGPRIDKGMDAMLQTVVNGKGAMPARGACANCSDDDLRNAVAYMVEKSK